MTARELNELPGFQEGVLLPRSCPMLDVCKGSWPCQGWELRLGEERCTL